MHRHLSRLFGARLRGVRTWGLLAILAATAVAGPAMAQTPVAAGLTAAQAQQVLDVLQNDTRRAQFVATLQSVAHALAATGAAPAPPPTPPPAPTAAVPAAVAPVQIEPDSLGAQVLETVSDRLASAEVQLADTFRAVTDYSLVIRWWTLVIDDPDARAQLLNFGWKLLVVAIVAGLAERAVIRLLRRSRRAIDEAGRTSRPGDDDDSPHEAAPGSSEAGDLAPRRHPSAAAMLRRVPLVLLRLLLDLIPVGVFAGIAVGLLGTRLGTPSNTRLMILALVNAYLVCRLVLCATRMMVSPAGPTLRLVHISDDAARSVMRWMRRMAGVGTFGYGLTGVAVLLGLYPSAREGLMKLVVLIVHAMLVIVVLEYRGPVAARLRAAPGARGTIAVLRNRFAATWHIIAIFYIVAIWLVWALEVADGFSKLVHFFFVTIGILGLMRLASIVVLGALDRLMRIGPDFAERFPGLETRATRYHPMLRACLTTAIMGAAVLTLFQAWGLEPLGWFEAGALGGRLASAMMTMLVTLAISLAVWEIANAAIERRLTVLSRAGDAPRAARLRTLMPMLRTSLLITLWIIAGLMVMSEIGINIAPLLAGAGVIGVAVGFGSQKLVQDIITGLFLLLENTMQVGDTVSLANLTGTIETLSVRTIRLRAVDGSVHSIPFSAVTSVTNMTRDFSYAVIDVESGFNEEPDVIAGILRDIAAEMRLEEAWRDALRDDLEVLGLEKFLENSWVLRVRIKTQPTKRWAVQREINRRVKYRFDKDAIESPFTSYRVLSNNPPPAVARTSPVMQVGQEAPP